MTYQESLQDGLFDLDAFSKEIKQELNAPIPNTKSGNTISCYICGEALAKTPTYRLEESTYFVTIHEWCKSYLTSSRNP